MELTQRRGGRGRLVVITAPSGAGKTTLVRALLQRLPDVEFSVSYTTRPRRGAERDGRDYFFVDAEQFQQMVEAGEFLEHARVFGHSYGTSRPYVAARLAAGRTVLLEIDWQGAAQIRQDMPEATSVFILPPSLAELERRLRSRGTESAEDVAARLSEALDDMRHWHEFDHLIVNNRLEHAADELAAVVAGCTEEHRTNRPAVRREASGIVNAAQPSSV